MGTGPQRGSKKHKQNKKGRSSTHHTKKPHKLDHDQVHANMKDAKAEKFTKPERDEDLPGLGQFYCISCDMHFVSEKVRAEHFKSKVHKVRVKKMKEEPHTQAMTEALGKL